MKQLKFGIDVFEGDICVYIGSDGGRYIIKVAEDSWCNDYINCDGHYYKTGGGCSGTWVEATLEEKLWLQACISAGKLVDKPKLYDYEIY